MIILDRPQLDQPLISFCDPGMVDLSDLYGAVFCEIGRKSPLDRLMAYFQIPNRGECEFSRDALETIKTRALDRYHELEPQFLAIDTFDPGRRLDDYSPLEQLAGLVAVLDAALRRFPKDSPTPA